MAIIQCPECGKSVSDRATSCPNCGCPIQAEQPNGMVKIKLSPVVAPTGFNGNQKVQISIQYGKVLYEGKSGDIPELYFEGPTRVLIKYFMSMMHYGGECTGIIDPKVSRKYSVSARQGIMSTKLALQPVDFIDAD